MQFNTEKEQMKGPDRWKRVYAVSRILFGWLVKRIRRFSYSDAETVSKTALILSNHNSDWDPLLMVIAMKRHMRFVASANIMNGFFGRIIAFLVSPIPREKGAGSDSALELIKESLHAGITVATFPEGNKSWDGKTCYISPKTARLAKESGCGLILFRFDGDYLQTPRWALKKKRGRVRGTVVREYLPEEMAEMTVDDVYEAICSGLYVNAFDYQREHMEKYRGRDRALGFENLAYLCPSCGAFGSIRTRGNEIFCACGLKMTYNEYGFLEGEKSLPSDAAEWNDFQKDFISKNRETLLSSVSEPICVDRDCLVTVTGRQNTASDAKCEVSTFGDRLEILSGTGEKLTLQWKEVEGMGMFRNTKVYMNWNGKSVMIERASGLPGIRYYALWRTLTGKPLY